MSGRGGVHQADEGGTGASMLPGGLRDGPQLTLVTGCARGTAHH